MKYVIVSLALLLGMQSAIARDKHSRRVTRKEKKLRKHRRQMQSNRDIVFGYHR